MITLFSINGARFYIQTSKLCRFKKTSPDFDERAVIDGHVEKAADAKRLGYLCIPTFLFV